MQPRLSILLACALALMIDAAPTNGLDMESNLSSRPFRQRLLIAVVTAPSHTKARQSIRNTWGADATRRGIPVRFFVGKISPDKPNARALEATLQRESDDLVHFDDFVESYHNLTAKALDIYKYAATNGYQGMLKVDDDSYVRVDKLLNFLSRNPDWNNLYAGQFVTNNPVEKDPTGRWYAYDQYPHEKWPTYANGPGVFVGTRMIQHISSNAGSLKRIRVDDAAVGVWVDGLNLRREPLPSSCFEYYPSREAVWINPVNADEMYRFHGGGAVILTACQSGNTACLCAGNPNFNVQQNHDCWKRASKATYTDVIPRYVQISASETL